MKKLVVLALTLACAVAMSVSAAEGKKGMTDEQKAVYKEMLEKYDTNKDGKLDKEERAKMSAEDQEKLKKLFPHKKKEQQ
ncbi:MAG: hypothetical protein WCO56_00100 [Verrucomicrobiota bacterium]